MNSVKKIIALKPQPWYEKERGGISVRQLERLMEGPLPDGYKDMIAAYENGISFDETISYRPMEPSPWATQGEKKQYLDFFYGLNNGVGGLKGAMETYRDRIPYQSIPIAEAPGGNVIILSVGAGDYGCVYLWDHEGDTSGIDASGAGKNVYLISRSFEEFILGLTGEADSVPTDVPGLKSMRLDF